MAVTGSGKFLGIVRGSMYWGIDGTQYGSARASQSPQQSYGKLNGLSGTMSYLNLQNLNKLSIGSMAGFTGTLPVLGYYYSPYPLIIWDPESMNINNIYSSMTYWQFVNGICVGRIS